MMKYFTILFGIAGFCIGIAWLVGGIHGIFVQKQMISTFKPVEAVILEFSSTRHSGSSYEPVIEYQYEVNGIQYRSKKTTPTDYSGPRRWVSNLMQSYNAGNVTTAYYNPVEPAEAYLIQRYAASPYTEVLFSGVYLFLGTGLFCIMLSHLETSKEWIPDQDGWFRKPPSLSTVRATRIFLMVSIAWIIVGVMTCLDYFSVIKPPVEYEFFATLVIYSWMGLILWGLTFYMFLQGRNYYEPIVMINQSRPQLGKDLRVRVVQRVRRNGTIKQMRLGIVCEQLLFRWKVLFKQTEETLVGKPEKKMDVLKHEFSILLPKELPPAGITGRILKKNTRWKLSIDTRMKRRPAISTQCLINVVNGKLVD